MIWNNIKRLVFLSIMSVSFFTFFNQSFAKDNCIDFDDGEVCLSISQDNNWYNISTSVRNNSNIPRVSCQVRTPEKVGATIYYQPGCEGKFKYEGTDRGDFTVYLEYNDSSKTIFYNLRDKTWDLKGGYDDGENDDNDDDDNHNNEDVDNFYVTVDDKTPRINQDLDITIKVRDRDNRTVYKYDEKIKFEIYKKSSNGNYYEASTSDYRIDDKYYDLYLRNQSSKELTNYIYFKKKGEYKIKVYQSDDSDINGYVYVDVDGENDDNDDDDNHNNEDIDNFYVTVDDKTPRINQNLDITIKVRDRDNRTVYKYDEKIKFEIYKKNSNGNYYEASTSDYRIDDKYYNLYLRNQSSKELTNYIYFKRKGEYKIKVYQSDDSDINGYVYVDVDGENDDNYDNDDDNYSNEDVKKLDISVNDTNPETYKKIDLYIKPKDRYNNTVDKYYKYLKFKVYKQESNGYYYEVGDSYFSQDSSSYKLNFRHQNYETLNDFFYFKRKGKYKIKVYQSDDSDINGYVYVDVDGENDDNDNHNNNDVDNFYLTVDDKTPRINQNLDITIKVRDRDNRTVYKYDEKIKFEIYKKSSNGNYYEASTSDYRIDDKYYNLYLRNQSSKELTNYIYFKRKGEYKIKVYQSNDLDINGYVYVYVDVDSSSSSSSKYEKKYTIKSDINEYITKNKRLDFKLRSEDKYGNIAKDYEDELKVYVLYLDPYTNKAKFATSYEYEKRYSTINFYKSNDGEKSISDLIKFKKNYLYFVLFVSKEASGYKIVNLR